MKHWLTIKKIYTRSKASINSNEIVLIPTICLTYNKSIKRELWIEFKFITIQYLILIKI